MMRFLDENGRIGGKVNLVDLIVLLLVVLIVAVMGVRLGVTDRSDTGVDVEKTVYQMEVRGLRSYSIDAVREGDQLYDSKDGVCMGTITGIEVKDTVDAIQGVDGTFEEGPVENRYDLIMTVETETKNTGGRRYVNGTNEVSVNSSMEMRTKYLKFTGTVVGIS